MSSAPPRARRRSPRASRVLAAVLLVGLVLPSAAAPVAADTSATVPAGFRDELVWSGLTFPTAVAFTPDASRVFVAEKSGRIRAYDGLTDATPVTVADLSDEVYDLWDRGLLGLAVDPDYPAKPYLYALYTYDSVPWHDTCPTPPGANTDGCLAMGRLSRLTVGDGGDGATISDETVLIEDWCQQFPGHSVGTVSFGPEGRAGGLYVSGGDGASFSHPRDSGQLGGSLADSPTPVNPCGDPASEGGALRSQDVRTTGDPTGLSGTIIRVDPDTGAAYAGNANVAAADPNARRIIGYGLRNPFRFTFAPNGAVWLGDVGFNNWEEIDELPDPDAAPRNFGWPCYEAFAQEAAYWSPASAPAYDPALCTSLTGQATPVHRYSHSTLGVAGDGCGTGSSAIAGLAFLRDDTGYPDDYDGGLFWTDYNRKCIWFAPLGTNGRPDFTARSRFADLRRSDDIGTNGASVFLGTTPDGDLLYTNFDRGEVRAIRFYPPNAPPSAAFVATPTSGAVPLTVALDASGSTNSNEHDELSYAWDLDGDGAYDDATGVTATTVIAESGDVAIGLRVTDDGDPVLSDTISHTVHAGNSPPDVTMTPSATLTWAVGDAIAFSASATDVQDGAVPAAAFSWTWAIAHCRPDECHEHVVQTFSGVTSGTFPAPDHPYPSHLTVTLVVTDADGLATTVERELQPRTGVIAATSSPAGIALHAYAENDLIDLPATGIVGSSIVLDAPPSATVGEGSYAFDHWSDGSVDAIHTVPVVAGTTTRKAVYRLLHTTDAANTCAAAPLERRGPEWRSGKLASGGDVDWYRFSMAAAGTVRLRLADLPVGASLRLYAGCTTLLAAQDRSGTSAEEIVRSLPAGTYAIKVSPTGAGSMTPYALQLARLPAGLSLASATSRVSGGTLTLSGEVWNDRSSARGPITVTARLLDASGALLTTWSGPAEVTATGRGRAPFRLSGPVPAGFAVRPVQRHGADGRHTEAGRPGDDGPHDHLGRRPVADQGHRRLELGRPRRPGGHGPVRRATATSST